MLHIFVDDERFPPDDGRDWRIARSMDEFVAVIASGEPIVHVSFDHDLGENTPTGHDIARQLIEWDLDGIGPTGRDFRLPDGFSYFVHSQNPIGAANIRGLLDSYLAHRQAAPAVRS